VKRYYENSSNGGVPNEAYMITVQKNTPWRGGNTATTATAKIYTALFSLGMLALSVLPSFVWWAVSCGKWANTISRVSLDSEGAVQVFCL
jgi:hypothetical protein